jgi:tetratricopeptide (TPR) repeat protein
LNGRLSDRLQLGRYPGPEETVEVVLNDPGRKPRGAIIVGLGKAGELSKHKLTISFANALREYSIKAVDNNLVEADGELTISTLLIGTGGTGLSVAHSVDAILAAVLEANKSFSQILVSGQGGSRSLYNIRIAEIQFVELFMDQAILAVKALQPFLNNNAFAIEPKLQKLQGGWKRIAYEEPAGWWNRVSIRAAELDNNSLIFSIPTDRARSEDSRLTIQRASLDRLIEKAVHNPNWDQKLASSIFELTIPNRIKGSFKDMQSLLFVVDREAAHYPWELMYDRRSGKDEPLVIQMGMVRQFSTSTFRERVIDVENMNVMVIGNPADTPAGFSNLPGAEQEAVRVASKLKEIGFAVTEAIHTNPEYIFTHLFSKDYRLLHLAGHGVYNYEYKASEEAKPEKYTGMVLGNGIFLTANEIEQNMHIPELVFINCCHLGKFSPGEEDKNPKYAFNEFAASLSESLINMGVKAVIAAGWAVDDAAAMTFAEIFYEHLLRGELFGDAVRAARIETYNLHKDRTNTWGAYQCYGDPTYRLMVNSNRATRGRDRFVDIEEAIVKFNQIYELAKTSSAQGIGKIRSDLEAVYRNIKENDEEWLEDARLLDALGEAYGEAFLFEEAVFFYDKAIKNGKSTAAIRAIEQRANCNIRVAVQKFDEKPTQYRRSKTKIKEQIKTLEKLIDTIGETSERLSMIGSGYKRLALISSEKDPEVCASALREMEKNYNLAYGKKKTAYPLTNVLIAKLSTSLRTGRLDSKQSSALKNLRDEVMTLAETENLIARDDFWATTGVTDVKLVDFIYEYVTGKKKVFDEKLHKELLGEYESTWRHFGSARQFNSILEQYSFLVAVLKGKDKHADLRTALEKFLSSLRSVYEEET